MNQTISYDRPVYTTMADERKSPLSARLSHVCRMMLTLNHIRPYEINSLAKLIFALEQFPSVIMEINITALVGHKLRPGDADAFCRLRLSEDRLQLAYVHDDEAVPETIVLEENIQNLPTLDAYSIVDVNEWFILAESFLLDYEPDEIELIVHDFSQPLSID